MRLVLFFVSFLFALILALSVSDNEHMPPFVVLSLNETEELKYLGDIIHSSEELNFQAINATEVPEASSTNIKPRLIQAENVCSRKSCYECAVTNNCAWSATTNGGSCVPSEEDKGWYYKVGVCPESEYEGQYCPSPRFTVTKDYKLTITLPSIDTPKYTYCEWAVINKDLRVLTLRLTKIKVDFQVIGRTLIS